MKNTLDKWFFWFWVKQYKVSILLTFLLIFYWLFSLYTIPKESSPDIKFWIIWITTIYTGVNPTDMDSLITEKIEKEIKDLEWIKKISSTSNLWVSSIIVELQTWVNTRDMLTDIKDKVDKVSLPTDAEDPVVNEISTNNEMMFSLYMYADENKMSYEDLYDKSVSLKKYLEWKSWITKVDISPDPDYEILVSINKNKLENYWLTLSQISNAIRTYNKNTPIWNYEIGDMKYDFRFDWELSEIKDLLNISIISWPWKNITLWNIAEVKKDYKSKNLISQVWFHNKSWFNYIKLTISKKPKISIFSTSSNAKKLIENKLKENNYKNIEFVYIEDLANEIIKDYKWLAKNAISTLVLVFTLLFIFLWFKEAVISTLLIPLAFFITFIVLNITGYSLNFLTNFSLLLTLWIALDTIIVIIEASSENMKRWFTPRTSVLLAVKEFKMALISWTSTTLVVFLPMMLLPGVMWKFLAYIPITVFITLLAWLFLSLTLNSPIFMLLNKNKKYFIHSWVSDAIKTKEEIELLKEERVWKEERNSNSGWFRYMIFWWLENFYYHSLQKNITKSWFRKSVILTPFILLILSFVFIAPKLWFNMFPSWDNPYMSLSVSSQDWKTTDFMKKYTKEITEVLNKIPEMKVFSLSVNNNKIDVTIELLDNKEREDLWLRTSFKVEEEINNKLNKLKSYWLKIETNVQSSWPPAWTPVWIKLIADSNKLFDTLVTVSKDFEEYLKTVKWTKNVKTSSSSTPWQFIFKLNNEKLSSLWLNPSDVLNEIYFLSAWIKAWTIKWTYDDHDILVKVDSFENKKLSAQDISEMLIPTRVWQIKIWNIATYEFLPAISTIKRDWWNVTISVESDIENWLNATDVQPLLIKFADWYKFPSWISYSQWWETSENADLIASTVSSFIIALFLIFTILVLQFNSFLQPAIILYSIVIALLWVNIWLYLTWNPYSMPFAIWFIALTWIVVNNAIILIDKINSNLSKWVDWVEAVSESWKSRLRPILLTTLTTLFGILPLALEDEFWAWLWFTIIFWLLFSSVMTLYVTPSLYYSLFLTPKKRFFIIRFFIWIFKLIKNIFLLILPKKKF